MPTELENLSRKHGLMLVTEDPDFLHCCYKCEVAESLGLVEACPQRVHTSNSCCPSCSKFLEHGLEAMFKHWEDSQFFVSFQIVIPINITEEMIRSAFNLHKVPSNQLRILFEWKNSLTLDIVFDKHIKWVMTIKHTYWPLDLSNPFLRDPAIYGLSGFSDRAGATVFSQLQELIEDFKSWLIENYDLDLGELFNEETTKPHQNVASYFVSYYLRFQNAEDLTIFILAPDYEKSDQPETCLISRGRGYIPVVSFQKINEALIMQKGLMAAWHNIEPSLQRMLGELTEITTKMRTPKAATVLHLTNLLDRVQTVQERFLKLKPAISNMQGQISPIVPLLSEPEIKNLFPTFNLNLVNSWLDFARSVERSVEGANSYIQGKMNLLALNEEKNTAKRLNLLTAIFGALSGLNLLIAFLAWYVDKPDISHALLIVLLGILSLILVARVVLKD